jgi:hypothetical protein
VRAYSQGWERYSVVYWYSIQYAGLGRVKKKKMLFRGPSTNDTKKQDGPSRLFAQVPHLGLLFRVVSLTVA